MKTINRNEDVRSRRAEVAGGETGEGRQGGRQEKAVNLERGARDCCAVAEFAEHVAAAEDGRAAGRIENSEGFWMLRFGGRLAVLPQHQGMFYVAHLLANPHAEPIAGVDLAGEVFEKFGEHEDFRPPIPMGYRDAARVAKILLRKEKRLEGIVDRDEEDIVVRVEALRELMVLDELKRLYFAQVAREAKNAGEVVAETLRELHATLACAVDARGNPHRVARDFAMHLLHYVLMPSTRVSAKEGVEMFVYRPAGEGN